MSHPSPPHVVSGTFCDRRGGRGATLREFTIPPLVTAPQVGGLADAVFVNAEEEPDRIVLSRRGKADDADWEHVTAAGFRDEVLAVAKGLLAQGIRFGDR